MVQKALADFSRADFSRADFSRLAFSRAGFSGAAFSWRRLDGSSAEPATVGATVGVTLTSGGDASSVVSRGVSGGVVRALRSPGIHRTPGSEPLRPNGLIGLSHVADERGPAVMPWR
ncbi:pentapeptide repeat-containing protein [Roseospirillum parvum]|uniref:pentapeptide repeat-containing protein n=1 Tax=Roseospirillum parvum TaxID=83401 RepID=UPI001160844B